MTARSPGPTQTSLERWRWYRNPIRWLGGDSGSTEDTVLARRATTLSVCSILYGEIDAMAPGMRGRLIFDLRTDLVTLG